MEVYCVKIGMMMGIDYCVEMGEGLPCPDFIRCWGKKLDAETLLRKRFSRDELEKIFCRYPTSRMEKIINALNMAKKRG